MQWLMEITHYTITLMLGDVLKIVYSDQKSGRSAQMEIDDERKALFLNRGIGDVIDGSAIGLTGYKLKITGGSSTSGFPMKRGIAGTGNIGILALTSRTGKHKGEHRRMTVVGSIISENTAQVNLVITEYGDKPIDEILPKKEEKKEGSAEAEAPAEEKK